MAVSTQPKFALSFDRARFVREMDTLIRHELREAGGAVPPQAAASRSAVAIAEAPVVLGHADVDEPAVQRRRTHGTGRDQAREHIELE